MDVTCTVQACRAELEATVCAVWNVDASIVVLDEGPAPPQFAPGRIALPAHIACAGDADGRRWYRAAALHAAARLAYSRTPFERGRLVPLALALVGLFEDARVEWLACHELPGLRRLWAPWHATERNDGIGAEGLMRRLARALIDPAHVDPHPWVRKGRQMFFVDGDAQVLALCRAEDVLRAARRLGHDLGQMRLPFNAPGYRVWPHYRDDHRGLWPPDATGDAPDAEPIGIPPPPAAELRRTWQPEWDRLARRRRSAWCQVIEREAPSLPGDAASTPVGLSAPMRRALDDRAWRRADEGTWLDLDAAIDWRAQRLAGGGGDASRLFRRSAVRGRASLAVLIDTSLSTGDGSPSVLAAARIAAVQLARAAWSARQRCAVHAFRSFGRQAVEVSRLKDWLDRPDPAFEARVSALVPGGSTRLGAALRHVAAGWPADAGAGPRVLVVLGDGEASDIDIHDPHYLVEDAHHAVQELRHAGIEVRWLALAGASRRLRR